MPKYTYYCSACNTTQEVKHSLHEVCDTCELCGEEGFMTRRPSEIFLSKKIDRSNDREEAGAVTKRVIEEAREELASDKELLKGREYKNG